MTPSGAWAVWLTSSSTFAWWPRQIKTCGRPCKKERSARAYISASTPSRSRFRPLRERTDDIRPLARFFIEHYNRKFKRGIEGLSDRATKLLLSYDWPGNVRELRNAIERGMILEESALITASNLPIAISRPDGHVPLGIPASTEIHNKWTVLEDSERSLVARALEQTSGNQTQAARLLGVTRDTLRYKKRKLDLA
jgi:transcriptional regulator with PAS, ATPase and Fis domain